MLVDTFPCPSLFPHPPRPVGRLWMRCGLLSVMWFLTSLACGVLRGIAACVFPPTPTSSCLRRRWPACRRHTSRGQHHQQQEGEGKGAPRGRGSHTRTHLSLCTLFVDTLSPPFSHLVLCPLSTSLLSSSPSSSQSSLSPFLIFRAFFVLRRVDVLHGNSSLLLRVHSLFFLFD